MNVMLILYSLESLLKSMPKEFRDQASALIEQKLKEVVDDMLDFVEDQIDATDTKIDDAPLGALIKYAREKLEIPDNIGGDEN